MPRLRRRPTPPPRRCRLRAAIIAALCLSTTGLVASPALATSLPLQGVYEGCAPYEPQPECANRLTQIGQAGFGVVVNYSAWYGDQAQLQAYADAAQAAGVKLIWPLNESAWRDPGSSTSLLSTYSTLAPTCGCSTNAGFVQYAINLVRSFPATWGYYIGDELGPSQASSVATLAAEVRQADSSHPLIYVALGSTSLASSLQPFESLANFVGADSYPIGSGGSVSDVGPIAQNVAQLSQANRTQPVMVLQAFDWSDYPGTQTAPSSWPTESEMQTMRNDALASNPSLILWYSFFDIQQSDDPAGHWQDLVNAAFAPMPAPVASTANAPMKRTHHRSHKRSRPRAGVASLRKHHRRHHRRHHHRATHHRRRHRRHARPREADLALVFSSMDLSSLF